MTHERVVITGLGLISALGHNVKDFWSELIAGQSGVGLIKHVDCEQMRFKLGAEVKGYAEEDFFSPSERPWLDRFSQFAFIAAKQAIDEAKIEPQKLQNARTAVITGSCLGGKTTEDECFYRLYSEKKRTAPPMSIPRIMANAGASHITAHYGINGPAYNVSTACASSTHAIGQAYQLIRHGLVDRAITGGSETPFSLGHLRAWEGLRVVSNSLCRPFSAERSGMVLGEGGAMLILESLSHAQQRGAHIYAEVAGFGMSADATHMMNPDINGQRIAIQSALSEAKLAPEQINYINAHGTGTLNNDETEAKTIQTMFPYAKDHLKVSATKAAHGHLLGAAGAIETLITTLAIAHQCVPPTLNFLAPDPLCNIPLVINKKEQTNLNAALCSSFAFGGLNAVLALKRFTG